MKNKPLLIGILAIAVAIVGGIFVSNNSIVFGQTFSTSIKGLPSALETQVIELKDGDTYNLTASFVKKNINGNQVRMLAYNGSIPGPTLKIPQGATVTVNFKNDTDVENTIHSHGVRMMNAFDGVPCLHGFALAPTHAHGSIAAAGDLRLEIRHDDLGRGELHCFGVQIERIANQRAGHELIERDLARAPRMAFAVFGKAPTGIER